MTVPAVPTPPESGITTSYAIDDIVTDVAGFMGGPADDETRELAIGYLDQAIERVNIAGVYPYRRKTKSYDTDDWDVGDTSLTMPGDWGWPETPIVIEDTDGATKRIGGWKDYPAFLAGATGLNSGSPSEDFPEMFAIQNRYEALIHCYPAIASTVGYIHIPYFARVLRLKAQQGGYIEITDETLHAVREGGKAYAMQYLYQSEPQRWQPFFKMFDNALASAKKAAYREQVVQDEWASPGELGRPVPLIERNRALYQGHSR